MITENKSIYICPECGTEGYDQDCETCDGFGEIEVDEGWEICEDCEGAGTLWDKAECPKCGHVWDID